MPKMTKAHRRDRRRRKSRYGHQGGGRGYLHTINRKEKERKELTKEKEA